MDFITIVVVDDHPLFRQGVADAFSLEPDFQIVGQADNGPAGLELIRQQQPAIAVIDVNLPDLNGQQLTRQLISEKSPTRIILLTAYDDLEQKEHAIRSGAAAYCTKDIQPEHLVEVIRKVAQGGSLFEDGKSEGVIPETWSNPQVEDTVRLYSEPLEPYQPLSGREMEVLTCVTRGMSNKEIANLLGISHQTVKNHVTAILRKLGVDDRTQAVVYALQRGWVRLHQQESHLQE